MTNHLRDTKTKRYYFDRAFLSVLPDASGFKLTWAGRRQARATVSKKTSNYTLLQLNLGRRIYSGKTANYRLASTWSTRAARRPAMSGSGRRSCRSRSGRSRRIRRRAARSRSSSRPATRSRSRPARSRRRRPDSAGRVVFQTRQARTSRLALLRLPRRRPAGRVRRADRDRTRSARPVDLTVRAWPDDTAWSERVGGLVTRALPRSRPRDRPALAARRRSRDPGGGQPLDRRLRRAVRSEGRRGRGGLLRRTTSSSSTSPRTPGSTARCSPIAGRTRRSRRITGSRRRRTSVSRAEPTR